MSDLFSQLKLALPDRYELERRLGSGGMATVYLARDRRHGRRVAIKLLRAELAGAVGQDRFLREIRIASELTHPHILPLLDSGSVTLNGDSLPYYVMPYIAGESLRDRLEREKQLPIEETIAIARDIAAALDHAHRHGFIHRDIKPENVLLAGPEAVVADFGIARAIDRSADPQALTTRGVAIGTAAYMSPEQASAQVELDGRTDIYSLGCVVYEMLGGDPPFSGASANAIAARHRVDPVPPLRTIRPAVSVPLEAAVMRALEKIPADRFNTVDQFASALSHQPTPTAPIESRRIAPSLKRRGLRIGAGSILVVGLVLFGWWMIRPDGEPNTPRRFPATPAWSFWRGSTGEYFRLFAVSDSLLVSMPLGGTAQLFNGRQWSPIAIPDSFQLLHYVGAVPNRRLLAVKATRNAAGHPVMQYWWLALSSAGLRPLAAIADSVPDYGVRPSWWSDGREVLLWQDAIRRSSGGAWVREPTGTGGVINSVWGRDFEHRFAIPSSRDSLLVFDGINWTLVDILGSPDGRHASLRTGTTFLDGGTVVTGNECTSDDRCRPLLVAQDSFTGPWYRIPIPDHVGIPITLVGTTGDQCAAGHFSFTNVAGRSRTGYFVWGYWDSCEPGPAATQRTGCPPGQPCFWRVSNGRIEPVMDLLGKGVQAVVYMGTTAYALLDDGTLWSRIGDQWRELTQVSGLPVRKVGATPGIVVRLTGGGLTYEPGWSDTTSSFFSVSMYGVPSGISAATPARALVVKDSTVALLTADGTVFVAHCRIERVGPQSTGGPVGSMQCDALTRLPPAPGRVRAIDVLADGRVIGVGPGGLVITWHHGVGETESLPPAARDDSLWAVIASARGSALAIGSTTIIERDAAAKWSLVRRIAVGVTPDVRFQVLPDGDLVVMERSVQVWDRRTDSLPVAVLYRPNMGELVAALHVLPDGRLVAGLANPEDPLLGGRLIVWAAPVRANHAGSVSLPATIDVTDLSDDGRYLYVVGRGGSLIVALDSLPFGKSIPAH